LPGTSCTSADDWEHSTRISLRSTKIRYGRCPPVHHTLRRRHSTGHCE
jgi:hypothetical protein